MAKRFVCYLLMLCLLGTMVPAMALAAEAEDPIDVTLSLYSNISHDTYISGLYDDNVFYITLKKLCELVDGTVTSQSNNHATIKVGIREFDLDVGSGNMAEKLYSENYNITMPSILKDGQIYISALHFLRYIGATVHIDEQANIQFMVIKRYDIFNAIEDFSASKSGYFFWWDEINAEYDEIKDMIVNAGVIALINRDSNIFRMMFDAKGMEREAVEDALLSIVKNEGAGYFNDDSKESELIDTASGLIGAESDWFSLITDAFQDTSELGNQISDLVDSAALTAGFTNNVVKAVESLKQFDNMSVMQKDLLATTILAHSNDSKTMNNQWEVVLDAARNVDAKFQSEYATQIGAATQVAQSTAYDLMNGVTGAAGTNPVSIAWNGTILLTKLIPFTNQMIGRKDKLYNAYNSSMIQLIANEMLVDAYSDWYYSNGIYTNVGTQYDMLNTVKQLMILQLKSTLTTREYLIQSGFLDENYTNQMKELNQDIALLLNKTENCKITGVNMYSAEYNDDLSWIANLINESPEEMYQEIISLFRDGISNGWANNESYGYGIVSNENAFEYSYMWYLYPVDSLSNAGYAFMDLDGNGVQELLVGRIGESGWDSDAGMIYDLYTHQDDEVIHLFSSGERDKFFVCSDLVIANEGAGDAALSGYDYYILDEATASLRLKERILYDGWTDEDNPWFYGTEDGAWDASRMIHISEEDAREIIKSYVFLPYELIPFDNAGSVYEGDFLPEESSQLAGTSGQLIGVLNYIVDDWTDGTTEYRIFADERFEDNIIHITNGQVMFRTNIESGTVVVTGEASANLAPYVQSDALQSWMELKYDSISDTIYIGNDSHPYYRMSNWLSGNTPDVKYNDLGDSTGEVPVEKKYGDNVTWTISNDVLWVTGVGKMDDYVSAAYVPWYDDRSKVTTAVMEGTITSVGSYAFDGFGKMTSITLPDAIRSIGEFAFWRCDDLPSIVIPNNCTVIGNNAFNWCERLESIMLPASITEIQWNAFANCEDLSDVYYAGTEQQWRSVNISRTGNEELLSATVHYNSTGSGD